MLTKTNLITTEELDDFDKITIIRGWFEQFTQEQRENLLNELSKTWIKKVEE